MQEKVNRLRSKFESISRNNQLALICYVVAGYPDIKATPKIIDALVAGGADIIEIGIPFSDPIADGPTHQRAAYAALRVGVTPSKALKIAKQVRKKHPNLPILIMTYSNIFVRRGWDEFISACKQAGVDGFILPDLPVEEATEYLQVASKYEMATVFLASPNTSDERLEKIIENSSGFVYLVSVYGTTGARQNFEKYTKIAVNKAKKTADGRIPLGVGFGISKPEHARFMAKAGADAIIVGSAITDKITHAKSRKSMLRDLKLFSTSLKHACSSRKE